MKTLLVPSTRLTVLIATYPHNKGPVPLVRAVSEQQRRQACPLPFGWLPAQSKPGKYNDFLGQNGTQPGLGHLNTFRLEGEQFKWPPNLFHNKNLFWAVSSSDPGNYHLSARKKGSILILLLDYFLESSFCSKLRAGLLCSFQSPKRSSAALRATVLRS